LGAYLAWRYADRDRPVLAGIGLAIALFKATIGLPVLVLLLLLGRWRPLAVGFVLTAVPGLVVAVTGLRFSGGVGGFVDALRDNLDLASSDGNNRLGAQLRIDLPSLVNRLTGVELPSVAEWAMFAVILGVTAGFVVVAARRGLRIDDPPVCIVVAAATVLSLASQNYNALLLAWPLLALLAAPTASLPPVGGRVLRVPAGAVALLLMVPPRTLVRALSIPWLEVRDVTSLLSGLVVALAAAAAVVTLRLPRQPVRPDTDGERGAPTGDERDELVLEPVGT
ncbi:MAG: glycosyltransferase 87 family protein, partial [Acidimicrobiia bacterium]